MRSISWTALLFLMTPFLAEAQARDTFITFSYTTPQTPVVLYEVSATGTVLATVATLPSGLMPFTVVMAGDNRNYRVLAYRQSTRTGLLLDVTPGGVVKTVVGGLPLYRPVAMVRTCDGDWILANQGYSVHDLEFYRLQGATLTTLSTVPNLLGFAMAVDEDTGLVVVRGQDRRTSVRYGYFRVDPMTGTVTDFAIHNPAQSSSVYYGAREPVFEGTTGAFVDMVYDISASGTRLCRAHPGTGITTLSSTLFPRAPIDMAMAGQRTVDVGYYLLARTATSPYSYDITRVKPDGTRLDASPVQGFTPYQRCTLLRVGSRHLAWFMDTPPNGRSLHLDFPGEGGLVYGVGFSLTGVRPGVTLPDRRVIPLNLDTLTVISLQGGVQDILENTVDTLDAAGRARVKVDTNSLGPALRGVKMWAVAVVFDPAASSGVAYIAGPTLLHIRK